LKTPLKVILLCLALSVRGYSQEKTWQVGLFSFFDNTEFSHSNVQIPQTMAGVRFAPELYMRLDSVHSIVAGINMLHEFGSSKALGDISPIVYYQYSRKPFGFMAGAFSRNFALDRYPRIFFQDSITYYRPNMNGLLLQYSRNQFFANIWLDWTSRQSHEMRETFFVGSSVKYNQGIFYVQHFNYMFHFAGKMDPVTDEALHDNLIFFTSFGLDFSGRTIFEKLEVNAGWVIGPDRARTNNTGWLFHHGFLSEARIEYKRCGLFNTFYTGESQMFYYSDHDNELYWGDSFYRTNTYNRSDFYIDFIKNDVASARIIFSFHLNKIRLKN
jgi:hypothetical protein